MDELKNNQQPQNAQQHQGGRHRRRHRHHGGNGGNGGNGGAQKPQQSQQNQQSQQHAQKSQNNQNNQNKQKQQQKQQQNKQKPQNNQNNQANQNKQSNQAHQNQQKQKQPQPQNNQKQKQKQGGNGGNQQKKDTYLYVLDGNLYVNLTNKCSNGCDFCVRNERDSYYGYNLWLRNGDPTAEKVIAAANAMNITQYKEAVFCGFGEPTYKVSEMVALCDYFHEKGLKTRLNTNGQGNLINKRDIVPELKDKIDLVNVSLNFSCAEKYQPVCRSQFGVSAFEALIEFARSCKRNDINCRFSIVDCIGEEEVEACKRLAEANRIPLYVRSYLTDTE